MYAVPNSPSCPLTTIKHFLSKCDPPAKSLFNQCCREALRCPSMYNTWYNVTPVKVKNFSAFMPDICKNAGVKRYTGHSLRSTSITAMSDAGLTDRSIMFMSDHKCEESLKSYCRRPSTVQKYKISSVLDNVATGNFSSSAALIPVAPSTSTAISPIQNNVTDTGQSVLTERTPLRSFDMPNQNVLVNSQSNLQNHKMSGFAANSQLKHVALVNFNFTRDVIYRDLDSIGYIVGRPVRSTLKANGGVDTAIDSAFDLASSMYHVLYIYNKKTV
ncbi:unnamed protein product [Mytilus coruscus]|uniref:Tyr recombinase domain-containing protein n=1 Tax=Mytilus coruscus TaxID=42192 RepID=A0A6J8ESF6_MYTCO|nr:unnamed protein product [Mytilus coruscus]